MAKKTIGKKYEYEMANRLGQGAFAEVYKGLNKETGEVVAIKVIKRSILARYGADMLEQIHREIKVLQDLVKRMNTKICPFVNKIFECLETDNHIYIVLEFCDGGTLLQYKKKSLNKLTEDEVVMIIFQLTNALAFIAEGNIAHRDIKPENVFLANGVFKLGDFGFAGQKQMYQTHLGTYPYMAPEFFNSKQYDGNRVDIWALGCMAHELLFNEIYFIGTTQYEVSQKIQNKPYVLKPDQKCSPEFADLLKKMIEKDPSKRITAAEMLSHPLFNGVKTSANYLKIIADEQAYMDKYFGKSSVSQQQSFQQEQSQVPEQVSPQKQPLVVQPSIGKQQDMVGTAPWEVIDTKKEENMIKIENGINLIRKGITFLLYFNGYLRTYHLDECRYEIFYNFKSAVVRINTLKEQLDQLEPLSVVDHSSFAGIEQKYWNIYYNGEKYQQLREEVAHERGVIYKEFIDYLNYVNTFTQINYPDKIALMNNFSQLNLQNNFQPELTEPSFRSKINYFKTQDLENPAIRLVILGLYISAQSNLLFDGTLADVNRLQGGYDNQNFAEMKQALR